MFDETLRFLCVGDIVGKIGRSCLENNIKALKKEYQAHSVIVNVENAAAGFGLTESIYKGFCSLPIDAMTSGNHIYDRRDILECIDDFERLARPVNFPPSQPGKGVVYYTCQSVEVAVINAIGRIFMSPSDCPFRCVEALLEDVYSRARIVFLDFHAETTSEKMAMAYFLDGNVSGVFGTHTHVQTADEKILNKGTAFITDLGMVGAYDSIIGMKKDEIVQKFIDQLPARFEPPSSGVCLFNAVLIDVNIKTAKATDIKRISRCFDVN